jgi:hypothetical protein
VVLLIVLWKGGNMGLRGLARKFLGGRPELRVIDSGVVLTEEETLARAAKREDALEKNTLNHILGRGMTETTFGEMMGLTSSGITWVLKQLDESVRVEYRRLFRRIMCNK